MEIKKGIAVSPGVAICPAVVLDAEDLRVPRRTVPRTAVRAQLTRLDEALASARTEVEELRNQVERDLGSETAAIFGFHIGLLADNHLIDQIHKHIDDEAVTAEYAVSSALRRIAQIFQSQSNSIFRERVTDIWDLERRVLRHLLAEKRSELGRIEQESAVVAHDLTPSQTASLDKKVIRAIALDAGGRTSHTAIVARALGIPAVVGLEDLSSVVSAGDMLIVDGNRGLVIINPDPAQLDEYRAYLKRIQVFERSLVSLAELPAVTLDGVRVNLRANIEFPSEITPALSHGAEGIGLYRTEYLFLASETEPDEAQQFAAFKKAITLLDGAPLTIRTFDLGADKYTQRQAANPERNPFLGCRSIRYCLQNLAMFKTHLRAILRASALGPLRIMFPLVTNMMELRQARMILHDVMEDLEETGEPFDPDVKVGIMIEVPSAALMARAFAAEADFFAIGTNDLVQYTLAVDRSNEHVAGLYSAAHPAVVMLVRDILRAANRAELPVSCCGEIAGEIEYTMLLIGLGLRDLSMTPGAIPEIKKMVRSVRLKDCQRVARRAAGYDSERQIINYLREETRKTLPEAFDGRAIG